MWEEKEFNEVGMNSNASVAYKAKFDEMLLALKVQAGQKTPSGFQPDVHVDSVITEKDIIGEIKTAYRDGFGKKHGLSFEHNGKTVGLFGEDYISLQKTCEKLQGEKDFYNVSLEFLEEMIFEWAKKKYRGEDQEVGPIEHLQNCAVEAVKVYEVISPIALTHIQTDFYLGNVHFISLTGFQIEKWFGKYGADHEMVNQQKKNITENFKGYMASSFSVEAEEKRAYELARLETERSLDAFRLFSGPAITPELDSYCVLWGMEKVETKHQFLVFQESIQKENSGFVTDKERRHHISNTDLFLSMKTGLASLHKLLKQTELSEFQEKYLSALRLYSKGILAKNLEDKLVYIFATLEGLLLKNSSEVIQQNVGDRMAFFLATAPEKRKRIVKNFKDVYQIRSKFFHHGVGIEGREEIKEMVQNTWYLLIGIIGTLEKFSTHAQFIEAIENVKYS